MADPTDLVNYAFDKKPVEFADTFNQLIQQKAHDAIEAHRITLAQSIYGADDDEVDVEEEEVETEADDDTADEDFEISDDELDLDDFDLDDIDLDDIDLDDDNEDLTDDSEDA